MKRFVAVFLALVISLQVFGMLTYAESNEYEGEVLAAINTSRVNSGSFSAYCKEEQDDGSEEYNDRAPAGTGEDNTGFDIIDDTQPLSPEEAEKLDAEEDRSKSGLNLKKTEYSVGDKKEISDDISVICIYIGKNCTVWTQIDDVTHEDVLSDKECVELGEWFDEMIPVELELFGDKRIDTDNDGKIAVFFHDMENCGGYVRCSDYIGENHKTENVWEGLNVNSINCDCVHVLRTNDFDYAKSTLVHEYQHYIHYSYGYVGKNNKTYFKDISSVTEGFSTSAEYILTGYFRRFYTGNEDYPLYTWENPDVSSGPYSLECTFFQYVRTRYAQLINDNAEEYPGKDIYRVILEKMTNENHNGFDIAADILYPDLKTTEERVKQLTIDFWTAVLLKEETGIHGFNGDRITDYIGVDIHYLIDDNDNDIREGMAKFYKINGGMGGTAVVESVEGAGDNGMVFLSFDNIYKKMYVDFDDGKGSQLYASREKDYDFWLPDAEEFAWKTTGLSLKYWEYNGEKCEDYEIESDEDITIKAVTETADLIECGKSYFDSNDYELKCWKFVPEETGFYKTTCSGWYFIKNSDGEYEEYATYFYDEETEESTEYYKFESGSEYYIYCYSTGYYTEEDEWVYDENTEFEISLQEIHYSLTYDFNGVGDYENWTVDGNDKYFVDGIWWEDEAILKTGKIFIGWSKNKSAVNPDYEDGDFIELTENTVFYAVFEEVPNVKEGTTELTAYDRYIFEADRDGYYQFTVEENGFVGFLDETDGETYYYEESFDDEDSLRFELKKGQRCIICCYYDSDVIIEKVSDLINFLVLGDSIAEGYGLSNDSSYGKIVAESNCYKYKNYAYAGESSDSLLNEIKYCLNEDKLLYYSISEADIINISVGGNDYLLPFLSDPLNNFFDYLFLFNTRTLDETTRELFNNLCGIYDEIRHINPDATIIFNNLYRPWKFIGYFPAKQVSDRVNSQLAKLKELHNDIMILDTDSVISGKSELIQNDTIHPSVKGHEVIAEKLLMMLYENNLGTEKEPVNYIVGENPDKSIIEDYYGHTVYVIAMILTGNISKLF